MKNFLSEQPLRKQNLSSEWLPCHRGPYILYYLNGFKEDFPQLTFITSPQDRGWFLTSGTPSDQTSITYPVYR